MAITNKTGERKDPVVSAIDLMAGKNALTSKLESRAASSFIGACRSFAYRLVNLAGVAEVVRLALRGRCARIILLDFALLFCCGQARQRGG